MAEGEQGRAAELDKQDTAKVDPHKVPWKPVLQVVGVLAGSAVWVQLVGSLDMWARFRQIGVAHTSTVALLPRDLLFATGVSALTLPVLAAIIVLGLLIAVHDVADAKTDDKVHRNSEHESPPGAIWIFLAVGIASLVIVVLSSLSVGLKVAVAVFVALGLLGIYLVVVFCTRDFGQAAVAIFVGTAILGGGLGVGLHYLAPARLDIAVAVRKDGPPIAGFYIGRSGDAIYLLTATPLGEPSAPISHDTEECRLHEISSGGPKCYVQQVVGVHTSDVVKFALGPRSVEVNARGYLAARALLNSLLQGEPAPSPPTPGGT